MPKISFSGLPYIAKRDKNFIQKSPELNQFTDFEPNFEGLKQAIGEKKYSQNRDFLVDILTEQYQGIPINKEVQLNLEKLRQKNCFTITTAHQPNLLTGHLYFIYKILNTIQFAREAKEKFPAYDFVPLYWMGSEDHDTNELNHFIAYNQRFEWQPATEKAFGRQEIDENLVQLIQDLIQKFPNTEKSSAIKNSLENSFTVGKTLGRGMFEWVNFLFQEYGLLILDQDNKALKSLFIPIFEQELIEQSSQKLVEEDIKRLSQIGYTAQAVPRTINLFFLNEAGRNRIVEENGIYTVLNTDLVFNRVEILAFLHQNPDYFSPNVVLRPIFQEYILPNLVYVGGGGELAYWMERQSLLHSIGLKQPILVRRASIFILNQAIKAKLSNLGLSFEDLYTDYDELARLYVAKNSEEEINLGNFKQELSVLYQKMNDLILKIDPVLDKAVAAEETKALNGLEQLEGKVLKAQKRKHETALQQIKSIQEKLFPNRSWQERNDNFLPYYLATTENFFELILSEIEAFNWELVVLEGV